MNKTYQAIKSSIVGSETVDSIMGVFNATIQRLEALTDKKTDEAKSRLEAAERATAEAQEAKTEAARASATALKLRALVGSV